MEKKNNTIIYIYIETEWLWLDYIGIYMYMM